MFEKLFRAADSLARHRDGPFAEDRRRFLDRCSQEGFSRVYLQASAHMLLGIAGELDASPGRSVTLAQIRAAANRWSRSKYGCVDRRDNKPHPRNAFITVAVSWFRFLGRFSEPPVTPEKSTSPPWVEMSPLMVTVPPVELISTRPTRTDEPMSP